MTPEPAPEIIMDSRGIYWRRYPTHLSMVPVSGDNESVPKPYVVYRRVGWEHEGGSGMTATGDLLARAERAEALLSTLGSALERATESLRFVCNVHNLTGAHPCPAAEEAVLGLAETSDALASYQEWSRRPEGEGGGD